MGKSTEPLKTRQYLTAETLTRPPNNLKLIQQTKVLIHNQLIDKAKVRLPTFSHNLHLSAHHIFLTLNNIPKITVHRLFDSIQFCAASFLVTHRIFLWAPLPLLFLLIIVSQNVILSVKTRLLPDKLLILNNLSVKPHLFTDKLSILSQLFTVIRFHGGEQDSLTPQKAKHPCRLTEVSEAEQPHRPLILIPLTLLFYWDFVPNPDTPCGLCVLHVFAVANTRTRPVVWWRLVNPANPIFKGAHQGLRAFHRRTAALPANSGPASDDALLLRCSFVAPFEQWPDSSNKVASVRACRPRH